MGYVVAIGNEGGGYLILGVKNKINPKTGSRDIVGSRALENIEDTKSQIFRKINLRIQIKEFLMDGGRVVVITIPNHPIGQPLKFHGQYLMRVGDELQDMDPNTLKNILNEQLGDFSKEFCDDATLNDLDGEAIDNLRKKWAEKTKNDSYLNFSNKIILEKLLLLQHKAITNAAILLLGSEEAVSKYIPNSEYILEWRSDTNKIEFDFRKAWRAAFLNIYNGVWDAVNSRNTRVPLRQGFFEKDIEYTRRKWIDKNIQKELLLQYFKDNKKGKISDFVKLFDNKLNRLQIQKLLSELRSSGLVFLMENRDLKVLIGN